MGAFASLALVSTLLAATAHATHFHGATLNTTREVVTTPTIQDKIHLVFESSWRSSYGWGAPISVGSTFVSGYSLAIKNSTGTTVFTVPITWTVTAVNPAEDLFTARFEYDYTTSDKGVISIEHSGGDRESTLAEGNHDKSWRIAADTPALVSGGPWRSPRPVSLPRVYAFATSQLNMAVPVVQRDSALTTMFTVAPIANSFLQSARPVGSAACFEQGPPAGPLVPNPAVNGPSAPCNCFSLPLSGVCAPALLTSQTAAGGVISWTPAIPARYAVQFSALAVDSLLVTRSAVPLDMAIAVVPPCPGAAGAGCLQPPAVSVASTYQAKAGIAHAIPVTATSPKPTGQTLYLFNTTLPAGATLSTTSGPGPQLAATINWTPTFAAVGDHPVCFQVTAADSDSGGKATSLGQQCITITVPPPTPPDPPTNVTAVRGPGTASVTFTPPVYPGETPITGYVVTSSPAGGVYTGNPMNTTRVITNLSLGVPYTFTVVAYNSGGGSVPSAPSNSVTPATVPGAPVITPPFVFGDGRVTMTVEQQASDGGSPVTGFTVTSTPAGGTDINAGSPNAQHTVTGLANGTTYTFRAVSTNDVGTSLQSSASPSQIPLGARPTVAMTVGASTIAFGQSTALTITLTNSNPVSSLAGLAFTSTLPAGVRATAGTQSVCGGTLTVTAGAISLASGSLAANSNCQIAVNLTGSQVSATPWAVAISSVTTSTTGLTGPMPSASTNILVSRAATNTAVTSTSPASPVIGQAYAVNYTLNVTEPGAGTPTGTVTVSDGTNICTGTLPATSCSLQGTVVGTVSLVANYGGSSSFAASSSAPFVLSIASRPTTTVIDSVAPNPSVVGVPVIVRARVTDNGFAVTPATGTVTISDGVDSCSFIPIGGTCNWTPTTVGARTLVATYNDNAGMTFAGSASAGMAHTVLDASQGQLLTVTRSGSGTGSVVSADALITCGVNCSYIYPNGTAITLTAAANAGSVFTGWLGPCVGTQPCALTVTAPVTLSTTFAPASPPLNLDVDGNSSVDLLSDGALLVRYLSALPDEALVDGALGGGTPLRTTAAQIRGYLVNMRPLLDVDGNGAVDMATDGVLLLRYLAGLRGDALLAGDAIGAGARRATAPGIESYISSLFPAP